MQAWICQWKANDWLRSRRKSFWTCNDAWSTRQTTYTFRKLIELVWLFTDYGSTGQSLSLRTPYGCHSSPFSKPKKMMVQTWFCTRNYVRELRIFTGKYGVLTATLRVVHLRVVCFDYIYGVITVKYGIITGKIHNSIHNPIGIIKSSKNMQKHHVSTPKSLLIPRNIWYWIINSSREEIWRELEASPGKRDHSFVVLWQFQAPRSQ